MVSESLLRNLVNLILVQRVTVPLLGFLVAGFR